MSVISTSAATTTAPQLQKWRQYQANKTSHAKGEAGGEQASPAPVTPVVSFSSLRIGSLGMTEAVADTSAAENAAASLQDELFSLLNAAAESGKNTLPAGAPEKTGAQDTNAQDTSAQDTSVTADAARPKTPEGAVA
jgi:hypothetical protein